MRAADGACPQIPKDLCVVGLGRVHALEFRFGQLQEALRQTKKFGVNSHTESHRELDRCTLHQYGDRIQVVTKRRQAQTQRLERSTAAARCRIENLSVRKPKGLHMVT